MKKLDHNVLAEGEVTGHAHRAIGGTLYEQRGGTLVLEPGEETRIVHEEHGAFTLPHTAEKFDVRKVQEYDHAAEAARAVAD